jgi:hypothetical protein
VVLAALAALGQVRVDHAERHAVDFALEPVLEVPLVVDRQQAQFREIGSVREVRLGRVAEAEEAGQLLHHEFLHIGLQAGDGDVADGDHDDCQHENHEEPELAPIAGQHDEEADGQQREAAADNEPAEQARLAPPALLRLQPGLKLGLVEGAEGQELRPRRCVGGVHGHDRNGSLRLRSPLSHSTAAARLAGRPRMCRAVPPELGQHTRPNFFESEEQPHVKEVYARFLGAKRVGQAGSAGRRGRSAD